MLNLKHTLKSATIHVQTSMSICFRPPDSLAALVQGGKRLQSNIVSTPVAIESLPHYSIIIFALALLRRSVATAARICYFQPTRRLVHRSAA